jgi:hypothetical protein
MLAAIREDGQPPEAAWPYLKKVPTDLSSWNPPVKPDPCYRRASARGRTSVGEVLQLLDKGTPVVMTMKLSDAFFRPGAGGLIDRIEPPDPNRRHGVIAVGHGTNSFHRLILIRNSWGAKWGIDGYAWVSEDYLTPRLYGFAEMREDLTNVSTHNTNTNMCSSMA